MSDTVLTIAMATRGEPDHVWFVLTALHANHPPVDYLVIDNTPERNPQVEAICKAVGGRYMHRPDLTGTSRPRDAVFRYAKTPWAVCIDSHVILETGAVQAALDYIAANPDGRDLVQGPLVYDDGRGVATHWKPTHPPGLWGTWDTDPRGLDPKAPAFEIPMMGLGLWMMRTAAWPGFHPGFSGFGGEEGYIHEVVRRRGGKALCLPGLRWRHKFRDVGGWHKNPAPPYPLRLEDHVRNLLVGHNELGIDVKSVIRTNFAKQLSDAQFDGLAKVADMIQPFGAPRPEVRRQKILAIWYSDNHAPLDMTLHSLRSVTAAQEQTLRHVVTVSACAWDVGNFNLLHGGTGAVAVNAFHGEKVRSHATIVAQIKQAVEVGLLRGVSRESLLESHYSEDVLYNYDAVCFCEHDVLYPPNYFDRIGDALAMNPDAPVVSNLDYIGLNGTGWQAVRERHEPLHQLTLRWDYFQQNLARAEAEATGGRQVILEPDHAGDRSRWVRLNPPDPTGMTGMPSVHVNHNAGRFTGHGDVCYEPRGRTLNHPHWGEAKSHWPHAMVTAESVDVTQFANAQPKRSGGGCMACAASAHKTPQEWADAERGKSSDFHEHVDTLRGLAAGCERATELSLWGKPADAAIVAGLTAQGKGAFTSVSPRAKPQWLKLKEWMGDRFTGLEADPDALAEIAPTDLLFVDTGHTAAALYPLLKRHHTRVDKYIAVHCTATYGEAGDAPDQKGVLAALRAFCHEHKEWVVKRRDENNHGLIVLSRCAEDVKAKPSHVRQGLNYVAARIRHEANGRKTVPLEVFEERYSHCDLCPERAIDGCAACGCPLDAKLSWASETCGLAKRNQAPKWGPWVELSK